MERNALASEIIAQLQAQNRLLLGAVAILTAALIGWRQYEHQDRVHGA